MLATVLGGRGLRSVLSRKRQYSTGCIKCQNTVSGPLHYVVLQTDMLQVSTNKWSAFTLRRTESGSATNENLWPFIWDANSFSLSLSLSFFLCVLRFGLFAVGTAGYMCHIYWMFNEDYGMFQESLLWVNTHRFNQKYLCAKLACYDDIDTRKDGLLAVTGIVPL